MLPADLWDLRKKHNLTCAALAEIAGVHKSQVTRWETGKQKIPQWLENLLRYWEQAESRSNRKNTVSVPERMLKRGVNPENDRKRGFKDARRVEFLPLRRIGRQSRSLSSPGF